MWTDRVVRTVLSNGLTIIVERHAAAPVTAVVTHVRAGYFDEPDEWVGISHVLEHMFFKRAELADEIQRLGGYLNAGTIYEKTIYYAVLPSESGSLSAALKLQADALTKLTVDSGELTRELEVITQEAKRKRDSPAAVAGETLYSNLFAQHRIRRWRIGTEDGLRRFTRDDVVDYYQTRYTPDRTIVAIVGDLDPDEVLAAAQSEFGSWDREPSTFLGSPAEINPPPPSFELLRGDVSRAIGVLGWRTRGGLHPDVAALDVASAVLGTGRASWLGRAVRQQGLASGASASHYSPEDIGVFTLFLEGRADRLDDAIERAVQLVHGMADSGIHHDDLACAKALMGSGWSRKMETADGRAMMFCEFEALGGYQKLDSWFDALNAVTADDATAAVRQYLSADSVSGVVYTDAGSSSRYVTADWPVPVTPRPPKDAFIPSGFKTYRATPTSTGRAFPDETRLMEFPGADVLVRSKRGSGLAYVGMYADSLRADEPVGQAGITSLMLRTSVRGAGQWNADNLARLAESLGGSVVPTIHAGWAGWGITTEQSSLGSAATLLVEIARSATLDEAMVEIEGSLLASDAARALDDMAHYPIRRVIQDALPGSWYGVPVLGEPDVVNRIGRDAVLEWAQELRRRRLTVVVVGDASVEELISQAMVFETWPAAERLLPTTRVFEWKSTRGAEPRDKEQTAMAMAFPAAPYGSPDHRPTVVAASMLGGLAGRLFHDLREQRALAYTVSASAWFRPRAGALLTYVAMSPGREDEARQQMLETLETFGRGGFTDDEIERGRNYVAGQLQLRYQSAHAVAGDILSAWLNNDLEDLSGRPHLYRNIPRADIEAAMLRIVVPDARAEYVVRGGGPSVVEAGGR